MEKLSRALKLKLLDSKSLPISNLNWINNRAIYSNITNSKKFFYKEFFGENLLYYYFTINTSFAILLKKKLISELYLKKKQLRFDQMIRTKAGINFLNQEFQNELVLEMSKGSSTEFNVKVWGEFSRARRCLEISLNDYLVHNFKKKSLEQIFHE